MTSRQRVSFGLPVSSKTKLPSSTRISESSRLGPPITSSSRISQSRETRKPIKKPAFTIPALSIPPKEPPIDPILERLKRKTIRRNAPEGEHRTKIREIIKSIDKEIVTVQEFVGLVAPYTGDNGNVLRSVMAEDLSYFRKMSKRVYDTMTQDVSDVLANEQIYLSEYFSEREKVFAEKLMRALTEIFQLAPNFDFKRYFENPKEHLEKLFPLPLGQVFSDPEEEALHKRQEAYHRLQWLRTEGERLNEENNQLQTRLNELKRMQHQQQVEFECREEVAEIQKEQLEATQNGLEQQLYELNRSVEKSMIETEADYSLQDKENFQNLKSAADARQVHVPRVRKREEPWNIKAARQIEQTSYEQSVESSLAGVSMLSVKKTGAVKKDIKPKFKQPKRKKKAQDSFHFSPIKTPPTKEHKREVSPFHYSPPTSPLGEVLSPPRQFSAYEHVTPQSQAHSAHFETVRVESSTTVIEQQAPQQVTQRPAERRNLAPKDTWGGFG